MNIGKYQVSLRLAHIKKVSIISLKKANLVPQPTLY